MKSSGLVNLGLAFSQPLRDCLTVLAAAEFLTLSFASRPCRIHGPLTHYLEVSVDAL